MYIPSDFNRDSFIYRIITGERGRENHEQIDLQTIFDVASITKLFTLILLLELENMGYLSLDEKICDINPDFQGLEDFTLNDLMRLHGKYWTDGNVAKAQSKEIFDAMDGKGTVLNKKIVKKLGEKTFPHGEHPEKGNLGVYVKNSKKDSYVSKLSSNGSFAHQGWTGSLVLFDPYNRVHQSILVNSIYSSSNKEKIKNDKPVFYLDALKHYKERMVDIGLKMRYIKNELDLCRNYRDENTELARAFRALRSLY